MKRILIFLTVMVLLGWASFAPAEKGVTIPFQPVPDEVQYVPNELVVELNPRLGKVSPRMVNGIAQIGIPGFDALNSTYKVDRMRAQFPGAKAQPVLPDLSRYFILRFDDSFRLEEVLRAYSGSAAVDHVEPIGIHPLYASYPSDYYFGPAGHPEFPYYQWYHNISSDHDMDSPEGWDIEKGDSTVILAMLDSGVRYYHKDLGGPDASFTNRRNSIHGNVWINWAEYNGTTGVDDDENGYLDDWVGWDWVEVDPRYPCGVTNGDPDYHYPDKDPSDYYGHGTHCAGLASAITNNARGVAGFAGGWGDGTTDSYGNGAKIMCLRIGWAECTAFGMSGWVRMDFAASALYYAADNGARIANASWGSSNTGGLEAAVDYFVAKGGLLVHAAGNGNSSSADYLGSRPDVMNVAATDSFDFKASFSNFGTWVDVCAPGVDIISLYHNHEDWFNDYVAVKSGTSMSSPLAAGLAALLWSQNPGWTRQQVFNHIVSTADNIDAYNPGYEGLLGSGRINAYKALQTAPDTIPPQVTVTAPNGGEILTAGQLYTITWDATDNVEVAQTSIYYSYDGGASYDLVDSLTGNLGSYDWGVPNTPSTQCLVTVYAYDGDGNQGWDVSDDFFTIEEAPAPYVWVKSIGMSIIKRGSNTNARAEVLIWDHDSNPVAGATIYGRWAGLTSDTDVFTTRKTGMGSCDSDKLKFPVGWWYFYVDDVIAAGYVFKSDLGETSDSIYTGGPAKLAIGTPNELSISQNYPNPFNPVTQFSIELTAQTYVSFVVYNIAGQVVRTLADGVLPAGLHTITWDGTNQAGQALSSGVYFYRVVAGDEVVTRKMTLLK